MQVLAVQMDVAWEDREANHRKARDLIVNARPPPGALVVLPEMFASGFSMAVKAIAEDESRPTERFLSDLASELRTFIVAGVVTTARSGKGLNQSVSIGPDGTILARYSKIHPFCLGGEQQQYEAGEEIITFRSGDFTVAPFVCYDLRFPEAFRQATRRGADLFTVIASWPDSRIDHWTTLLRARAIENQAYVVGVNRVGDDPTPLHYCGRSLIVDPMGKILADAGETEGVASAELSVDHVTTLREKLPFLKDMQ